MEIRELPFDIKVKSAEEDIHSSFVADWFSLVLWLMPTVWEIRMDALLGGTSYEQVMTIQSTRIGFGGEIRSAQRPEEVETITVWNYLIQAEKKIF